MLLVLDNRDSFTFNLVQALQERGAEVRVERATRISVDGVRDLAPERILIGPGPGGPADAGCSTAVITELSSEVPILGVCLGHQALGLAFGARIGPARELVHGRTVEVRHDGRGVFEHVPQPARFTRYNSLAVLADSVPACLEVSAVAADGDVMGLRHRDRPLEGVQFHPESILSEHASRLFENFLRL